jgi:hypothetical protein
MIAIVSFRQNSWTKLLSDVQGEKCLAVQWKWKQERIRLAVLNLAQQAS